MIKTYVGDYPPHPSNYPWNEGIPYPSYPWPPQPNFSENISWSLYKILTDLAEELDTAGHSEAARLTRARRDNLLMNQLG